MQLPLQVSFRHMDHSEEIDALVREKAAALDRFARDIMSCRVVVELSGDPVAVASGAQADRQRNRHEHNERLPDEVHSALA